MSTHKHIDRICVVITLLALLITILFMNGEALGLTASARTMGYEKTLFDTSRVHTINIVIDDWDAFIQTATSEEYATCSVVIGLILLVFANRKAHFNPYIVVLSCDDKAAEDRALTLLKEKTAKCVCKSKTARAGQVELNLEVRLADDNTDFVNELAALEGVQSAVLVSYNGEYMG